MKKVNLLIALLICLTASAQIDHNFGVKAGTNYSQFVADWDHDFKGKIGYYVGGFFNIEISDNTSIRPELLLANQGTKTSVEIDNDFNGNLMIVEGEIVSNTNQLMILLPVNFRVELVNRLHLELGIQGGYILKMQEVFKKVPYDPSLEGEKNEYSLSESDRFDFGLNGGLGFDLSDRLELNARYSLGLIELNDVYKTSVISLGLGFKI